MTDGFWLAENERLLTSLYQGERQHHAVLIQTMSGIESDKIIEQVILWLMCQNRLEDKACGHCRHCQLAQAKHHADIHIIAPEKEKRSISIDQIRQLTRKVYEHAQQGHHKVIWIQQIEDLTEAAANALLKTLEEPPEQTFFLLTCQQIETVLPTIRSRCLHVKLRAPNPADTLAWLQKNHPNHTKNQLITALSLSHFAPLDAQFLLAPEAWAVRQQFFDALTLAIENNDYFSLLATFNQSQCLTLLYWFSAVLGDALKYQMQTTQSIINRDQPKVIQQLAHYSSQRLLTMYQHIVKAEKTLDRVASINQELVLSQLLLTLENEQDIV